MSKPEIIVNKELGFQAIVNRTSHSFEFSIYEIQNTDAVSEQPTNEAVIHGNVYWNHTSSWRVGTRSRYHCTSRDTLQKISKILTVCFDYTEKNLKTWDTEID